MSDKTYKLIAQNKKAFHNYTLTEKLEVGIALLGHEVKSIRQGRIHIRESFARVIKDELWLFNCHIPPYEQAHRIVKLDPVRNRKLLLHKRQLKKWIGKTQEKGLTLIPTKLYFSGSKVKLEIGLGAAKKIHDKRAKLKEKASNRDIQRHLKR
jgi:SsrA-binding protein